MWMHLRSFLKRYDLERNSPFFIKAVGTLFERMGRPQPTFELSAF